MGFVATYSSTVFAARYPEFASISTTTAPEYFIEAGLYLNNTGLSPVQDAATQLMLMNMLTAHLAELYDASSARGSQALVGRISDASEGTVKVTTDKMTASPGVAAWFQQTKYGASFWQATLRYRSLRFVRGSWWGGGGGPWGGGPGRGGFPWGNC